MIRSLVQHKTSHGHQHLLPVLKLLHHLRKFSLICFQFQQFYNVLFVHNRYRKETQDDQLATPMSVAETVGTPMSVDKTSLDDEQKALACKNDRERFFEVAEYQKDILKYLKITEVKTHYLCLNML